MAINERTRKIHRARKFAIATTLVSFLPACSNPLKDNGEARNEAQVVEGPRRPPLLNPQGSVGKQAIVMGATTPEGFVPPHYAGDVTAPATSVPYSKLDEQLRANNSAALQAPLEQPVITPPKSTWSEIKDFFTPDSTPAKPEPAATNLKMDNMALEVAAPAPAVELEERKPLQSNPNYRPGLIAAPELPPAIVIEEPVRKQIGAPQKSVEDIKAPAKLLASISSADKQVTPAPIAMPEPIAIAVPAPTPEPVALAVPVLEPIVPTATPEVIIEPVAQTATETVSEREDEEFDLFDWLFGKTEEPAAKPEIPPMAAESILRKPLLSSPPEMQLSGGADRLQAVPPVPPALPEAQKQAPVELRRMQDERGFNEQQGEMLKREVEEDKPNSLLPPPPMGDAPPSPPPGSLPPLPVPNEQQPQFAPPPPMPAPRKDFPASSRLYLPPPSAPDNIAAYLLPEFAPRSEGPAEHPVIAARATMGESWFISATAVAIEGQSAKTIV